LKNKKRKRKRKKEKLFLYVKEIHNNYIYNVIIIYSIIKKNYLTILNKVPSALADSWFRPY